jgi:hypothetical protein
VHVFSLGFQQGTGFSESEKDRLGIRGLVPPRVFEMDLQLQRIMMNLNQCRDNLEKYVFLSALSDRNLTAFYKVSAVLCCAPLHLRFLTCDTLDRFSSRI